MTHVKQGGIFIIDECLTLSFLYIHRVFTTGKGQFNDDFLLYMNRSGYVEEAYFSFTLSPMFTEDGNVGGIFNAVQETTQRVLMARRLKTLGDLANGTQGTDIILYNNVILLVFCICLSMSYSFQHKYRRQINRKCLSLHY